MPHETDALTGLLLDEAAELGLAELCHACQVHADFVIRMVEEGLLVPRGRNPAQWRFPAVALHHARLALRLEQDLDVNLAGSALVIDLLEQLRQANQRIAILERQLDW
ncbi:chaperone modulator CbpM [Thiohalobacter thiocyanaticus]|uniref:MerR family transcriptional regulator n=1 Tax=Thiohalobacter thiocyanaticus TaxID=585455 RepID=A0A426QKG2_9GAMM|nr:chaperone modulator CbpM [Thiohalobacter thiocyanaticus]RRQ22242.1 MerR family transcriptional regulator [Thiohalobacter thiocyanaticus]